MKTFLLANLLLSLSPATRAVEEATPVQTIVCGQDTIVLEDNDKSPDGRHSLGWTIRPVGKDVPPVDWSEPDSAKFWDRIHKANGSGNSKYAEIYVMVDMVRKASVDLPGSEVCFSGLRTSFSTRWLTPDMALVELSDRFSTINLYLVNCGKDGLNCVDLSGGFHGELGKLVGTKRPLSPDMGADCELSEAVLKGDQLQIPIFVMLPKGSPEDFEGTLHISLKTSRVVAVTSEVKADHPFVGELGKEDRRLNAVYRELRQSLAGERREQLVAEQRAWLKSRHQALFEFARFQDIWQAGDDLPIPKEYYQARNKVALEITKDRVEILEKALKNIRQTP